MGPVIQQSARSNLDPNRRPDERYRYFCTDCQDWRQALCSGRRCPMCGGGRIIDTEKPVHG